MHFKDDLSDILVEEVMTEVANTFFGERKHLEESIGVLKNYVEILKEKEKRVTARAAFLNYLLVTPEIAGAFYQSLSLPAGLFMAEGKADHSILPEYPPPALTFKGEYIKLANWAYEALQTECTHYMKGQADGLAKAPGNGESDANFKLIDSMCYLINEKVDQVNQQMAPGQVLQYVKRFDHETRCKEQMTGSGSFYGDECTMNRKMAFRHIDCHSLMLTRYPELPLPGKAAKKISAACKKSWNSHSTEMKQRLKQVKEMCRQRKTK